MGAIGLGFALLIASSVWTTLFPPTRSWTLEKAERMSEVKARINDVGAMLYKATHHIHSGPDPGSLKAEFDALTKEFEVLKADFESATLRSNSIAAFLKWTGISLAALGIIGWYAVKQTS